MGAGPSVMYASHAREAFAQFANAGFKPPALPDAGKPQSDAARGSLHQPG